jgi:DNA processing protein
VNPSPDELRAWLRLSASAVLAPAQWRLLLAHLGGPEQIFASGRASVSALVGAEAARNLHKEPDGALAATIERAIEWCEQPDQHCLTLADARYPRGLLEIHDPPALVFARGDTSCLALPTIALLTAATPSREGALNARQFARALAERAWMIVLPDARGFAAPAALIDEHSARHTIVTEGPGGSFTPSIEGKYQARLWLSTELGGAALPRTTRAGAQRLAIGVSRALLVVEAGLGSAGMATARAGAECGREVLAIPGSIHAPLSKGCHRLIKDGAKLVETIDDITQELVSPKSAPH